MKINALLKKILNVALGQTTLRRTVEQTPSEPATIPERETVGATTVAGRPPRRDINQGGRPGRNV